MLLTATLATQMFFLKKKCFYCNLWSLPGPGISCVLSILEQVGLNCQSG